LLSYASATWGNAIITVILPLDARTMPCEIVPCLSTLTSTFILVLRTLLALEERLAKHALELTLLVL
jgi:hypothetical protein